MPSQANIAVTDAAAVTHTFVPNGAVQVNPSRIDAEWVNRTGFTSKLAYEKLVLQQLFGARGKMDKYRWIMSKPTLESLSNNTMSGINPAPTWAYDVTGVVEVWAPERATPAEIVDALRFLGQGCLSASFMTVMSNRERWT